MPSDLCHNVPYGSELRTCAPDRSASAEPRHRLHSFADGAAWPCCIDGPRRTHNDFGDAGVDPLQTARTFCPAAAQIGLGTLGIGRRDAASPPRVAALWRPCSHRKETTAMAREPIVSASCYRHARHCIILEHSFEQFAGERIHLFNSRGITCCP